jgi:hypothetical protein
MLIGQNILALNAPLATGKAKCPCIECSSCNRKYNWHDNQPKEAGYKNHRSNGKVPCPIHSFPDKLARHKWAECLENLVNQKKPALQSAVDARNTTIDNCYLSNDGRSVIDSYHTKAADMTTEASISARTAILMTTLPPFWILISCVQESCRKGHQMQ